MMLVAGDPVGAVGGVYRLDPAPAGSPGSAMAAAVQVAEARGLVCLVADRQRRLVYGLAVGADAGTSPARDRLLVWRCEGEGLVLAGSLQLARGGAAHVAMSGAALFVAYYGTSAVGRVALDEDGLPREERWVALPGSSVDVSRQERSHPHHVLPDGDRIIITDLGADVLWLLDSETLEPRGSWPVQPGTGPRHTVRLAKGMLATSGELDETLLIQAAQRGTVIDRLPSSGRAAEAPVRNYPSDLIARPDDGRVVLANRGNDTLTLFEADSSGQARRLDEVDAGGRWPLNLEWEGSERFLVALRDGDRVARFRLRGDRLEPDGFVSVPRPTWVLSLDERR